MAKAKFQQLYLKILKISIQK